ncbi:hypothetical protein OGAPHI_002288 [Ogataea philodendri]|uniref:DMAP1-binding domain-containing protein n=1 Tax=Ogataea philodendri TaxID=1378263 RepID=A0A9P8PC48_9ASCO|nr:uncharacterized protein OGAPHI_002288 [Ogataea philodendri]KAH3668534.1 hypothetical protein OGAPHI_002288 [Ogataea philodendri]
MDFTIPRNCSQAIEEQLLKLINEFQEGYLTEKGYINKRLELLQSSPSRQASTLTPRTPLSKVTTVLSTSTSTSTPNPSESNDFDLASGEITSFPEDNNESVSQGFTYENDYYSYPELVQQSQHGAGLPKELQKPLDPRDVDETSENEFSNLPSILRHRGSLYKKEPAIVIIDAKGKETQSISWERLYLRAEKIAQKIKNKAALYPGDRVCLIYQNTEIIDLVVAIYACFFSGTVAVPMNSGLSVRELVKIMTDTQSHLCLMSDSVFKHFERQSAAAKNNIWPRGMDIWKTTDMGLASKDEEAPAMKISDLAYIAYAKSSFGELRGVVISHRTIMHQMRSLLSMLSSAPNAESPAFVRSDVKYTRSKDTFLSTLDARESVGLVFSVLFTIFSGNTLIWMPQRLTEVAGLLAHVISKYKVSVMLSDYLSLKQVAYNYQSFPQMTRTFNKKTKVDVSSVKWCLIDTVIVDCEFNDMLINRWLRPLGHKSPRKAIAPILALNEHGGAIISMRDWIGKEENLGCTFNKPITDDLPNDGYEDDEGNTQNDKLSELLIDKASLTSNTVKVVSDNPPPISTLMDNSDSKKFVRVGAFGYPLPDATLAIVNPETKLLSGLMEVGEIWVDSHCISGGFWSLAEATQAIFQAECSDYEGILNLKFVRTGLLGFTYNGKLYVLGLYEDRINQKVTWFDKYLQQKKTDETSVSKLIPNQYTYHYAGHLVKALVRNINEISDCSFFNIRINREYLPVAIIESPSARSLQNSLHNSERLNYPLLDEIASRAFQVLEQTQNVRLYFVLITAPNVLSRTPRSGRPEIANMLCKRRLIEGKVPAVYVKFNFSNSLSAIPHGDDIRGGVWSLYSSNTRLEALDFSELQYSGLDLREQCIDDRTNMQLTEFNSILEIFKLRALKQSDEMAFGTIERLNVKESKSLSWKKFESRVFAVCAYILEKENLRAGDRVLLIYPLSEEVIICLYACWLAGLVPILLPPLDVTRMDEDAFSLVAIVKDYDARAIFVNHEVESLLKNKPISPKLKTYSSQLKAAIPKLRNTSKHTKTTLGTKLMYKKMEDYKSRPRKKRSECLIWISWNSDHQYTGAKLTHSNLLRMCKTLKETCQISSLKPLLACVRHCSGIGFLQAAMLGIYVGTTTYLISPVDYSVNPASFFLSLARYKIENVFITEKMMNHAITRPPPKKCDLSILKNLMVGWDGRPSSLLFKEFLKHMQSTDLSPFSVSNVYQHDLNPMISLRSYLSFVPVDLWLDPLALSQSYISLVNPSDSPNAIHLQDSGIVPVNTQLAIVNPETSKICKVGECGEIWVCSESTVSSVTKCQNSTFDNFRLKAKIENWNQDLDYLRTGDLGFLHNVTKTLENGNIIEVQLLFVLGKIEETFEVLGMQYFAQDIETSVNDLVNSLSSSSSNLSIRSCVFKAGNYIVLVLEAGRSPNLSALVPLIVNKILNQFGLIIDIVSFYGPETLPISRLGEIQRGTCIKNWLQGSPTPLKSFGVNEGEEKMNKLIDLIEETTNT